MGAWGAIIMGFFGAVFAALTLALALHQSPPVPYLAFAIFAVLAAAAWRVIRRPGTGIAPSEAAGKAILWSSIGEGVGLFVAANVVTNTGHPEWLLPAMALVVGLHFLPIAWGAAFPFFYALGAMLLAAAAAGFVMAPPLGSAVSGFAAAGALWLASILAIRRDGRAKAAAP